MSLRSFGVRRALRAAGIVALPLLLAIVLFAPSTVGGKVLSPADLTLLQAPYPQPPPGTRAGNPLQYDAAYTFEPDGLQVRAALRDLRLPVWSPLLAAGTPLLATQQTAPLYPLTWLGVIFPYWHSLVWIAVLKLALAALGTYLFGRALGLSRWASMLAAISFAFGCYLIDWLEHPHSNVYILAPWLLLCTECCSRRGRLRDGGYLAVLTGLAVLGGQPEAAFIVLSAAAGWLLYRLLAPSAALRLRVLALWLAGVAVGVGIGAVMVLPLIEMLRLSPGYSRSVPALGPKFLYSLLFPEWWGRPTGGGQVPGPANFAERTFYVGVLPLVLAGAGFCGRRPRSDQLAIAGGLVVSLVIALRPGPIGTVLAHLPGFDTIDLQRYLIVTSLALALLAAFGLDALLEATAAERRRIIAVAALIVIVPAVAMIATHLSWLDGLGQAAHRLVDRDLVLDGSGLALASVLRWLLLGGLSIAAIAALWRWPRAPLALACVLALTAVDLMLVNWGYNNSITTRQAQPATPEAVQVMRHITRSGGRVVGLGSAMLPSVGSRWGLAQANGPENPLVQRDSRLADDLGAVQPSASLVTFPGTDPRTPKLLSLLGVKAVILPAGSLIGSKLTTAPVLDGDPIAYNGADGVVVRIPGALPQAFVAYRWRASRSEDESILMAAAGDARGDRDDPAIETSATARGAGAQITADAAAPAATVARLRRQSTTAVTVDVRARAAGQLVVLDTYYPGWHATVDGRSVPIRAANGAFDAIAVPKGSHVVRLSYHPTSVRDGVIVSLVSLALALAAIVFGAGVPGCVRRVEARECEASPA